ncbi:hypothetical protein LSH36_362g04006 [Paralvinella palmiformis]|uniref:ER membrane protein complex subunit 4 n=1 Tax=Paralvinella palmiformis TaxID=53620 RepID=A0AAD9JE29_9ANNE|nr:hypothetical protein LSH36_362g04006 [Paralvinella palmiformis]
MAEEQKRKWPEVVDKDGEEAKSIILKECPNLRSSIRSNLGHTTVGQLSGDTVKYEPSVNRSRYRNPSFPTSNPNPGVPCQISAGQVITSGNIFIPEGNRLYVIGRILRSKDRQVVTSDLPNPIGYTEMRSKADGGMRDKNTSLVTKKSWDVALAPLKQIPMNLFIMWMAGNSISIFPIMMVGMMFIRPIQAIISVQQTFKLIEGEHQYLQRAMYVLGLLTSLGMAVYKCQVMGLLPTHPSDWLAFVEPQMRMEWSGGGAAL